MTSSKKIENPKTQLDNTSSINEFDLLSSSLSINKYLSNYYAAAMLQASHEKLYILLSEMLKDTSLQYRKLFDLQFQHGWHSFTPANPNEVSELLDEFQKYKEELQ